MNSVTLIECFSKDHLDNIAACLRLRPKKLIFVGNLGEMQEPVRRYQRLLQQRGISTEILMRDAGKMDLDDLCAAFRRLLSETEECVIDLAGGDSKVAMAIGAALAGLDLQTRSKIRVERFDRTENMVVDCTNDSRKCPENPIQLTVEQIIALHGGMIYPDSYQPPVTYSTRDIDGLWRLVSDEPKEWNRSVMLLREFESRADSKTQVYLPLQYIRSSISHYEQKEPTVRALLEKLHRYGVIEDRSSRYALEYTYCSPLLQFCMQKAGNVLEVKTLLEGRKVLENGRPFFNDCQMGVGIDWDSVLYTPEQRMPETRNEIDVLMMHGTTPLFISCKNGNIGDDELFKLHTVATRFGGVHARKMLIATNLDRGNPTANRAFMQRAWDMDIFLVTDAGELSSSEWQDIFRRAVL